MLFHKTVTIEKEDSAQSGIIDPSKKSQVGIITEIGSELIDAEQDSASLDIKVGDRVVYYENSVTEIEFDGKTEYVLDFDDIIKTINKKG